MEVRLGENAGDDRSYPARQLRVKLSPKKPSCAWRAPHASLQSRGSIPDEPPENGLSPRPAFDLSDRHGQLGNRRENPRGRGGEVCVGQDADGVHGLVVG
jgi:hypothetical protein